MALAILSVGIGQSAGHAGCVERLPPRLVGKAVAAIPREYQVVHEQYPQEFRPLGEPLGYHPVLIGWVTFPLGWLCATMIVALAVWIATAKTSRDGSPANRGCRSSPPFCCSTATTASQVHSSSYGRYPRRVDGSLAARQSPWRSRTPGPSRTARRRRRGAWCAGIQAS